MNRIDRHLEILASRARQAPMLEQAPAPTGFAAGVLKACRPLSRDLPLNSMADGKTWSGWFLDRQWTRSRAESDESLLWMKFSLASLPIGAIITIACLFWFGTDFSHDFDDLASSFIQSP